MNIDVDKITQIHFKTDFPVRHAIAFSNYSEKINITRELASFNDFIYNTEKRRISYVCKYDNYAVYEMSISSLAIASGIAAGVILASIFSLSRGGFALASTISSTVGLYLNKQVPKYIYSKDPSILKFNFEFIMKNLQIPLDKIDNFTRTENHFSYEFIDRDGKEEFFRKSVQELIDKSNKGLKNLPTPPELLKYALYALLGYGGYKIYTYEKKEAKN